MFYVYLLGVSALGVAAIMIWHYLIYLFVKEFDKRTYIRGYKKDCGKFSKVVTAIYELVTFYSLLILTPIGIVYLGTTGMLRKRKAYMFARFFVTTPILIATFIAIGNVGFHYIITALNLELFLPFYEYFLKFIIKLDIIFYGALCIKLIRFNYASENVTIEKFKDQLPEYKSKRDLWKKIRNIEIEEEFSVDFCLRYNSFEEWQASQHYQQTYGVMCKVLNIYGPAIILVISLLYTQVSYVLTHYEMLTRYYITYSIQFGDVLELKNLYLYYTWAHSIIVPIYAWGCVVYLFNLSKSKVTMKKGIHIVQVTLVLLTSIVIIKNISSDIDYLAEKHKDEVVLESGGNISTLSEMNMHALEAIRHSRDYANYSLDEKVYYIMQHPSKLKPILKEKEFEKVNYDDLENKAYHLESLNEGYIEDEKEIDELLSGNEYACTQIECKVTFLLTDPKYQYIYVGTDSYSNYYVYLYSVGEPIQVEEVRLKKRSEKLNPEVMEVLRSKFPEIDENNVNYVEMIVMRSHEIEELENFSREELVEEYNKVEYIYVLLETLVDPIFDEIINH